MKLLSGLTFSLIIFACTSFASAEELSRAGLFVEPMVTYQTGDVDVSYPAPFSDSKEDLKGFGLGLRLGFHVYESIFLGLDGRYSRPDYDSSALGGKASADSWNGGVTLGAQTPVAGLRVWGTYILGGTLNPEEIGGVDVKFNDLKGYRIGAGIYLGVVSLNAEYQDAKYDSTSVEKAGPISGTTDDINGHDKSWIFSVSFPVSI